MAPDGIEDLLRRRADYPILARCAYLVNNSLGAMHRETPSRLAEFADLWAREGVLAWETWFPHLRAAADLVARIIGAPPGSVLLRQNVADALAAAVSALPVEGTRRKVVCTDQDWPGTHYLWRAHREADLVTIKTNHVDIDVEQIVDAIDEHTAVVSVSQVAFGSSARIDPAPLATKAHAMGAVVVLDAYHAAGVVPMDVAGWDVDVCVGGSVKYLCGGPGNGWLYVRPDLVETLQPTSVGWLSHEEPFAFETAPIRYAPGIARFTGGTPAVPAAYAAVPGYQAILDVGTSRIRARSVALTQRLMAAADEAGFTVRSPRDPDRRGGHVTIDPGSSAAVHAQLIQRGFLVDHRPDVGIRVGPHFFTTDEECDALVAEMVSLCR